MDGFLCDAPDGDGVSAVHDDAGEVVLACQEAYRLEMRRVTRVSPSVVRPSSMTKIMGNFWIAAELERVVPQLERRLLLCTERNHNAAPPVELVRQRHSRTKVERIFRKARLNEH